MESVAPETDDYDEREAQDREDARDAEMTGRGEGVIARHDPERQHAKQVGDQDEHEQRKEVGRELAAFGADVGLDHVTDEAGHAFDRNLPAARDKLAPHAAIHEESDHQ